MKNIKMHYVIGGFTFLIIACSTITGNPDVVINNQQNIDNSIINTPIPDVEIVDEPFQLFIDDFSEIKSGWPTSSNENSTTEYLNGEYLISVHRADYLAWVYMEDTYNDMILEVDATFEDGGDDNSFGLICRHADTDNFYVFVISADGYAGIAKTLAGGDLLVIGEETLQPSAAVKEGKNPNHIVASCIGETLTLTVNGMLVAEVMDTSIVNGSFGMIVSTYDILETSVSFDNFKISIP